MNVALQDLTLWFCYKTVTFDMSVSLPNGATVQSVAIDVDGNGTDDYTAATMDALPKTFTYYEPGLFNAILKVTDTAGNVHQARQQVLVTDRVAHRYMLVDIYGYLKARMAASDVNGAALAFQPVARNSYTTYFSALGADLPSTVQSMGVVGDGQFGNGFADLTLVMYNTDQTRSGFPLHLTRGSDGVWRISEL